MKSSTYNHSPLWPVKAEWVFSANFCVSRWDQEVEISGNLVSVGTVMLRDWGS